MPSTPQARAVAEGKAHPQLPDALELESRKVIPGLQLPKGTAKRPVVIVRHVPFSEQVVAGSNQKLVSNKINETGHFRGPTICTSCVAAMYNWNAKHKTGRGANNFNEYISCLTHKSYGNGGEQCARCVGLGKGPQCCDVPPVLYADVKELIKAIPQHNRLLKEHAALAGHEWPAEDRQFMVGLANKAAVFKGALDAHNAKHGRVERETPRKKRKIEVATPSDKQLSALASASTDTRTDVQKVQMSVGTVSSAVGRLAQEVADLKRMAVIARARQDWLCGAVMELVNLAKFKQRVALDQVGADEEVPDEYPLITRPFCVEDIDMHEPDLEGCDESEEESVL